MLKAFWDVRAILGTKARPLINCKHLKRATNKCRKEKQGLIVVLEWCVWVGVFFLFRIFWTDSSGLVVSIIMEKMLMNGRFCTS